MIRIILEMVKDEHGDHGIIGRIDLDGTATVDEIMEFYANMTTSIQYGYKTFIEENNLNAPPHFLLLNTRVVLEAMKELKESVLAKASGSEPEKPLKMFKVDFPDGGNGNGG